MQGGRQQQEEGNEREWGTGQERNEKKAARPALGPGRNLYLRLLKFMTKRFRIILRRLINVKPERDGKRERERERESVRATDS